jgi:ketosteroid isomerase-like protein
MKEAFLTYLAEDGVIFRPPAVNGRKLWQERSNPSGTLIWEPHYAEVSAAGDLGLTYGPWEYRMHAGGRDTTVDTGTFVTLWRKQADGSWRFVVDGGVSHPLSGPGLGSGAFTAGPAHTAPARAAGDATRGRAELTALDRDWARLLSSGGMPRAFENRVAEDVRYFRDGEPPAIGHPQACDAMAKTKGAVTCRTENALVAKSADFGCTYGLTEIRAGAKSAPDSVGFFRVWRRATDGRWRLVVAVDKPMSSVKK